MRTYVVFSYCGYVCILQASGDREETAREQRLSINMRNESYKYAAFLLTNNNGVREQPIGFCPGYNMSTHHPCRQPYTSPYSLRPHIAL